MPSAPISTASDSEKRFLANRRIFDSAIAQWPLGFSEPKAFMEAMLAKFAAITEIEQFRRIAIEAEELVNNSDRRLEPWEIRHAMQVRP